MGRAVKSLVNTYGSLKTVASVARVKVRTQRNTDERKSVRKLGADGCGGKKNLRALRKLASYQMNAEERG